MATEKIIKQFTGNNFIESKDILGATAKGTEENFYLDPIPRLNKLGYVYSNIVSDIGARIAARTDSIKMNRDNMDYTNDRESDGKVYDLSVVSAYDLNNDGVIGIDDANILLTYYAYKQTTVSGSIDEYFDKIFSQKIASNEVSSLPSELINYTSEYNTDYPDRIIANMEGESYFSPKQDGTNDYYLFMYQDSDEHNTLDYYKNLFSDKLTIIENYESGNAVGASSILELIKDEGNGNPYITVEQLADNFGFYKTQSFLNLLMPQYKRRVEIEDLDENFWVIGQILDAVVNSIFGKNNIIDILMNIIDRLNDIDIQINLINKMIGLGNEMSIQLGGPSSVSSCDLFSFELINPRIITEYGYRDINTPFSNRIEVKYTGEETADSFSSYCDAFNTKQYELQSQSSYLTNVRSDMLFYGKRDNQAESFGKFRTYLHNNYLNQSGYSDSLKNITSAYLLSQDEMNVLIINMNEYKIYEAPFNGQVSIQEKENENSKMTFNNTIVVHNSKLYSKEMILIALGTTISKYENINTGLGWNNGGLNQLKLCVAHSEAYDYSDNSYYVLKESKINVVESDDEVTFNNDLSGFKVYYFKPRQTKLIAAKNSTNIYSPSKTVQHINDISKNDIFAQRFYLYQGDGDYIDYQYYHGRMAYFGAGATVSSDFAEHGLIGFMSKSSAKMVSDSKNSFIYFNKNTNTFEKSNRKTWVSVMSENSLLLPDSFESIIINSLPDDGYITSDQNNFKYLQDHRVLLQLCRNMNLKYKCILPIFFYSSMTSQPYLSTKLTGLKFSVKPRDAFCRTADDLCILPIFSNGESGGNILDIGLRKDNENALQLSCFNWEYIDSNSEDVNNHISKILYRYAYANNNEAIVSAQPYSDNFKYLVGYLFIFANSGSTQPDVDINDLSLYGTVDDNDSILFNNGTHFSATNVAINQKWSK